jgi:hypothetical protein
VTVHFSDLCLEGTVKMRDCFAKRDLPDVTTGEYSIIVPPHGTRIYTVEGERRIERIRYEAETAYIGVYQEIRNNQSERTGIYDYANFCSCGLKASWLGMSDKNDLVFRDVYSDEGGEYTLNIGYVCGENRSLRVSVNGGTSTNVTGMNSGNWSKVGVKKLTVKLKAGRNTIRLYNQSAWMPDIDYIELISTKVLNSVTSVKNDPQPSTTVHSLDGTVLPSDPTLPSADKGVYIINQKKVLKH